MDEFDFIEYATVIHLAPPASILKEIAYRNEEMPEGLTSAAQTFYQKARCSYKVCTDPGQGAREMVELERAYEHDIGKEKQQFEIAKLWPRIEPTSVALVKHPTVENAKRFWEAVYRNKPNWGDEVGIS